MAQQTTFLPSIATRPPPQKKIGEEIVLSPPKWVQQQE